MVAKIIEKQKVKKAATGEGSENKENEWSKVKQALRMKCNVLVHTQRIKAEKTGLWRVSVYKIIFKNTAYFKCL